MDETYELSFELIGGGFASLVTGPLAPFGSAIGSFMGGLIYNIGKKIPTGPYVPKDWEEQKYPLIYH